MDNFEEEYRSAVAAGQRNLKASKLLSNWCFHAELVRHPGRGLIEAETGLPIGHMGVQCKFSRKDSVQCWLLEDAAYDFYQSNCKSCSERIPVAVPNILQFVAPREKAAEKRSRAREEEDLKRKQAQAKRREERAQLRSHLSLEETFVLDLIDELDQEDIKKNDPRLEHLANLAPETFTKKVINHLLPAALHERLPYSMPAAKALLRTSLEPDKKLSVAVRLVNKREQSPAACEEVLAGAERLVRRDLEKVLLPFVSMALSSPPGLHFGASEPRRLDSAPIRSLFQKRRTDISAIVDDLIISKNPSSFGAAVEIVLAADEDALLARHVRSIVAKLMRRRTLLPGEQRDSRVLYYLRAAVSKCLERFPEETDNVIQSLLLDNDDKGKAEAYRAYRSVLKQQLSGETEQIGTAQRVAFKRLLWAAVADAEDSMSVAGQFFRHHSGGFSELVSDHFDDLIGAAATLSERYEALGAEHSLALPDHALSRIERRNKLTAIDDLQGALIIWAAAGAKSRGREGIFEYLELYRRLPQDQIQMRGNMIAHVSKLLGGVESLTLVLSEWYGALVDESALVRARAVGAWEDVPYDLVKSFPDLFFEAFSVLLTDPYVIVHRSAVHSLRRRSFPKDKRGLIKAGLWNLILHYVKESEQEDFVVDCIDTFSFLCLSSEERKGKFGQLLSAILLTLEGSALYKAVDRLHRGFAEVPGFAKVALKAIQDDYTRSISTDDCASAILNTSRQELRRCVDELQVALETLEPYRPENTHEALLYAASLTKAGGYAASGACFEKLLANIPLEARHNLWRLQTALVAVASDIEHAIESGRSLSELIERWGCLLSDLENEHEEQAKLRDFPASFFFES